MQSFWDQWSCFLWSVEKPLTRIVFGSVEHSGPSKEKPWREIERKESQAMDALETRHRERPRSGDGCHIHRAGHVQLQPGVQNGAAASDDRRDHGNREPVS